MPSGEITAAALESAGHTPEVEDWIVKARKAMPRRGPRKLRAILVERNPGILKRRGLSRPRKIRQRAPPLRQPFADALGPNDTWCIDFKGKFRMQDGKNVEKVLDSAFQEFGLPKAMRSDNGPPFASTGAGRLSKLSVWWLKLGIQLERIELGKPQQNGRLERCHLTVEEVVTPSAENLVEQRRAIDEWRRDYNEVRPHQALGDVPPTLVCRKSPRRYPRKLLKPEPPAGAKPATSIAMAASAGASTNCFSPVPSQARSSSWKGAARPPGRSSSSTSSSANSTSGRSIVES